MRSKVHCVTLSLQVTDLGIAKDTDGHLQGCLEKAIAMGIDVLITSGESQINVS